MAFYAMEVLSLAEGGGSNVGEVLRIATQLIPHDFESTYNAFHYMAEEIHSIAASINIAIDPVGAREAYFRAATYYRAAGFFLTGNQKDPRLWTLWDKQTESFNNAIALLKPYP